MRVLYILAVAGLALSVFVHIATLFGFDPGRIFPPELLHAGVFIVLVPISLASRQLRLRPHLKPQAAPKWMTLVALSLFFYFIFSVIALKGPYDRDKPPTRHDDGRYSVMVGSGGGVREITEEEYHRRQAWLYRKFSGAWMLFYCLSVSLYESRRKTNLPLAKASDVSKK